MIIQDTAKSNEILETNDKKEDQIIKTNSEIHKIEEEVDEKYFKSSEPK